MRLYQGHYRNKLEGVYPDALIFDPPYSERVHSGHDQVSGAYIKGRIEYASWGKEDVWECATWAHRRVKGWIVVICDHVSIPLWEAVFAKIENRHLAPYYVFAPIPFVHRGRSVRVRGDGPSSWSSWILVARPSMAEFSSWGTLPGAYVLPHGLPAQERERLITGGKPLWLMRSLVRDYTKRGDLVCDPCAGAGTTLLAALIEGRRAVGAELDPDTWRKGRERLLSGWTPNLPGIEREPRQADLVGRKPRKEKDCSGQMRPGGLCPANRNS